MTTTNDLIARLRDREAFVFQWPAYLMRTAEEAADALETLRRERDEAVAALRALSNMYGSTWDRTDGALVMMGSGKERFEAAHKEARRVLGIELTEIDESGALFPEHAPYEMAGYFQKSFNQDTESFGWEQVNDAYKHDSDVVVLYQRTLTKPADRGNT